MSDDAVAGSRHFVGDKLPEGTAHLVFVRSTHAHARIAAIDTEPASAMPTVRLVLTAADLRHLGSFPSRFRPNAPHGGPIPEIGIPALAGDRVRYVGEAVAAVVADNLHDALEAAEAISVDYDPLPSAASIEEALADDAPRIWPEIDGNLCFIDRIGDWDLVQRRLHEATHVTRLDLRVNRVTAAPMETRRALAVPEPGRLVLHAPLQAPHTIRNLLADHVLKCPRNELRVAVPAVGGGFGMKGSPHAEDAVVLEAARRLDRPVYWESTRGEAMLSDHQGRDALCTVALAFDGLKLTAIEWQLTGGLGAYTAFNGIHTLVNNRWGVTGLYGVEAAAVESRGVMTNAPPIAPYRGAGRPEATMTIERAMDVAAHELGVDPWELRRANLATEDAFPLRTALGLEVDTADPVLAYEMLIERCDRAGFPARRTAAAARGRLRGLGVAHFMEIAGGPPGKPQKEGMALRMSDDGRLSITAGTVDAGQDHDRLVRTVLAKLLGPIDVPIDFRCGDTDLTAEGVGTFGSRSTMVLSHLLDGTTREFLRLLAPAAGKLLEAAVADVTYDAASALFLIGGTNRTASFGAVAAHHIAANGPIAIEQFAAPDDATCPYGFHAAEVEIDPETGGLELCAYFAVDDVGNPIDHTRIEAQLHGGITQGFGQAVMEAIRFDGEGGQPLSGSFMDYGMPRAADLCYFDTAEIAIPAAGNALGVKGVGEAGAVASLSAVANAVHDALHELGIRHLDPPYTPQLLWQAITDARA